MPAGVLPLIIEQYDQFLYLLEFFNDQAMTDPFDLTGYTAQMNLALDYGCASFYGMATGDANESLQISSPPTLGTMLLYIPASQTAGFSQQFTEAVYILQMKPASGDPWRALQGPITYSKGISPFTGTDSLMAAREPKVIKIPGFKDPRSK